MNDAKFMGSMSAFIALLVAIVCAMADPPACEQQCTAGFVNLKTVFGGIECEHGPGRNPDCYECHKVEGGVVKKFDPRRFSCCETLGLPGASNVGDNCIFWKDDNHNGMIEGNEFYEDTIGDCNGQNGELKCHCFKCNLVANPKCEGRIVVWKAHCGIYPVAPQENCVTHLEADPPEGPPVKSIIRYEVPQVLNQVQQCSGAQGSTNDLKKKFLCGADGDIWYADCISVNGCVDDMNFNELNVACGQVGVECGKRRLCGP